MNVRTRSPASDGVANGEHKHRSRAGALFALGGYFLSLESTRSKTDDFWSLLTIAIENIPKVCRALEHEYGNPRHGNKSNPLDELIYIVVSTRTQDWNFRERIRGSSGSFRAGIRSRQRI